MRPHSPILASLANIFRIPITRPQVTPSTSTILQTLSARNSQQTSSFSTTPSLAKRKSAYKPDKRITLIRYFLYHPLTPRPLRFSRNRYLRHWTIHRAWQLYQSKLRTQQETELYRQQQAMSAACEELRTNCGERGAKLFRVSMNKRGVFTDLFPIEYARLQTDSPGREGWNHGWKRM
ncbi:hypothetical protein ZTR_01078 [Talaromyces verruculosus]|nr:hypothetical protein ZTR_01078 [Talaromyces verruculosus]